MTTPESELACRESTSGGPSATASISHKRAYEERLPAISSPLNPEAKSVKIQKEDSPAAMVRDKPTRTKKDSLKKRESKAVAAAAAAAAAGRTESPRPSQTSTKSQKLPSAATTDLGPQNLRYILTPPKLTDFDPPKGSVYIHHHDVSDPDGNAISFHEVTDHVHNKKLFSYTYCIADPTFPSSFYYRQTEPEPYGPHMSLQDSAINMFFDPSATHVTTDKGFRMSRANVSVREGRWYWECRITRGMLTHPDPANNNPPANGHVRVGWARKEASLDAPVGFDAYSYGFRDVHGEKVHMSRPKSFFPPGEGILEGDVIGLEIHLPSETLHKKVVTGNYNQAVDGADSYDDPGAPNIVRDRVPTRYKGRVYFEKGAYHSTKELEDLMNPSPIVSTSTRNAESVATGTGRRITGAAARGASASDPPNPNHVIPALRTLPRSCIRLYKNGKPMGEPFTQLLAFLPPASRPAAGPTNRDGLDDGTLGYYPAVSVFRGGAAQVNFGPNFWCPPEGLFDQSEPCVSADKDGDVEMSGTGNRYSAAAAAARATFDRKRRLEQVKSMSERYIDQIVEDIVYDVIDEVDFWARDGGVVVDKLPPVGSKLNGTAVPQREDIKELVQDD